MSDDERVEELFKTLEETIQELMQITTSQMYGDSEDELVVVVPEWFAAAGVLVYKNGVRVHDDVAPIARDEVPLWRIRGLIDGARGKLDVEDHYQLLEIDFDEGDEDGPS
jgi:hypothetical protein